MNELKRKNAIIFTLAAITAVVVMIMGLMAGSVPYSVREVICGMFGVKGFETQNVIVNYLRGPRVIGSALAGTALAVSGVILQTITDNSLCSANVLGINSGAGLTVMLMLCFFPSAFALYPLAAFVGSFWVTIIVIGLAKSAGTGKTDIILAGIAISAICSAVISFLSLRYPDHLASYTAFTTGSFSDVHWKHLVFPSIVIFLGIIASFVLMPSLEILCLGDSMALSLGIRVKQVRTACLIIVSMLVAAVVSYAGVLSFVGLIVPHISRRLVGSSVKKVLPLSALLGLILTELADIAGRTLFAPTELPSGIITALLGAPFFLYLLIVRRRRVYD